MIAYLLTVGLTVAFGTMAAVATLVFLARSWRDWARPGRHGRGRGPAVPVHYWPGEAPPLETALWLADVERRVSGPVA